MSETNLYLAEMLRVSARGYAAVAAEQLLDAHPECADRFGPAAFSDWQANFVQRLNELAIAVEMEEPSLFRSQVAWTRDAFNARSVPVGDLVRSLRALDAALREELPEGVEGVHGPYVEAALEALQDEDPPGYARLDGDSEAGRVALRYVDAAISGDQRGAVQVVLDAVGNGLSIRDAYEQVLLPAEVEIGRMWHLDEIGVAEEHAATGTTCAVMSVLAWQGLEPVRDSPLVLLAGVEGDRHDVGLRATAGLLEASGYRAISLGADVPTAEIVRAVAQSGPDVVVLSATLAIHLRPLRKLIRALRDLESGSGFRILVAGPVLSQAPQLVDRLEADDYLASPGDAVDRLAGATGSAPAG